MRRVAVRAKAVEGCLACLTVALLARPALAQDCGPDEKPLGGQCCPSHATEYDPVHRICKVPSVTRALEVDENVAAPAASPAAAPAASSAAPQPAGAAPTSSPAASRPAPRSQGAPELSFTIQPALTCDGAPCRDLRIWADGHAADKTAQGDFAIRTTRSLVQIDAQAPGYGLSHAYVEPRQDQECLLLRGALPRLPNLTVTFERAPDGSFEATVYAVADGKTVASCSVDPLGSRDKQCSMVVPFESGQDSRIVDVKVVGTTSTRVYGVTLERGGTKEIVLQINPETGSKGWYLVPGGLGVLAGVFVFAGAAQQNDVDKMQNYLAIGGGLTAAAAAATALVLHHTSLLSTDPNCQEYSSLPASGTATTPRTPGGKCTAQGQVSRATPPGSVRPAVGLSGLGVRW
jgi:hypothetical protein